MNDDGPGMIFDQPREMQAFERWQKGEFLELERLYARSWRQALEKIDLNEMRSLKGALESAGQLPKSLQQAHDIAHASVEGRGITSLATAINLFSIPAKYHRAISQRWQFEAPQSLFQFAPYVAYCLKLELFFLLSTVKGLLSTRPTNRIDIAYLYYLPFAQVFSSNDKLHRMVAPYFLRDDQHFIWGEDLKRDLHRLDQFFSQQPEEERSRGLFRFATRPPADESFITSRLWKSIFGVESLTIPDIQIGQRLNESEAVQKILDKIKNLDATAKHVSRAESASQGELASMAIQRSIPIQRGKWRIMPPDFKG